MRRPRRNSKTISVLGNLDLDESEDAPPVSEQIVAALMANAGKILDLFRSWDDNFDGVITRVEFHEALRILGLDVEEETIDIIFTQWDRDASGCITLDELTKILRSASTATKHIESLRKLIARKGRNICQCFREWDLDGNGEIDRHEFSRALRSVGLKGLSDEQIFAVFASMDRDGGGTISFQELNKVIIKDFEKEKAAKKKRLEAERMAKYLQDEDPVDMTNLRQQTLSKLKQYDDEGWRVMSPTAGKAAGAAHYAVASAMMQQRIPRDASPPGGRTTPESVGRTSPELRADARKVEVQKRQMRLRLRGTLLVHEDKDAADHEITNILRRLPPGPKKTVSRRPATSEFSKSAESEEADSTVQELAPRHDYRSGINLTRERPEPFPKLLDVLSAHRVRAPVPVRPNFAESLPPLPRRPARQSSVPTIPMCDPSKLRSPPAIKRKKDEAEARCRRLAAPYGTGAWAATTKAKASMVKSATLPELLLRVAAAVSKADDGKNAI